MPEKFWSNLIPSRSKTARHTPIHDLLYHATPPCAIPAPKGAGARTMPRYYLHSELLPVQVIQHYRNWGTPTLAEGGGLPEPPGASSACVSPTAPFLLAQFLRRRSKKRSQIAPVGRSLPHLTTCTVPTTAAIRNALKTPVLFSLKRLFSRNTRFNRE